MTRVAGLLKGGTEALCWSCLVTSGCVEGPLWGGAVERAGPQLARPGRYLLSPAASLTASGACAAQDLEVSSAGAQHPQTEEEVRQVIAEARIVLPILR